jgi:hypothetical protein
MGRRVTGLGLRMAGTTKSSPTANFVGAVSTEIASWLWAGNNDSVDPELCKARSRGPRTVRSRDFYILSCRPKQPAQEVNSWEITAITAFLLRLKASERTLYSGVFPEDRGEMSPQTWASAFELRWRKGLVRLAVVPPVTAHRAA